MLSKGIQNTARGRVENIDRARQPRAFYNEDMVVKEYSVDDAIYYDSLTIIEKRQDFLITGFSNFSRKNKSIYVALTTKYISLIDEDLRTTLIEILRLIKITQPSDFQICFEYKTVEGNQRMTLNVEPGKLTAKQILEELHLQIGLIIARA